MADPEFARGESEAMGVAKDMIEDEIKRRAIEGVEEPVYQGGKLVGHVRHYSDTLLLRLAERYETGSWRSKVQVEQTTDLSNPTRAHRKERLEKARAQIAANRRGRPIDRYFNRRKVGRRSMALRSRRTMVCLAHRGGRLPSVGKLGDRRVSRLAMHPGSTRQPSRSARPV